MSGQGQAVAVGEPTRIASTEAPPQDSVVRFVVDDMALHLDISGLEPQSQRNTKIIGERGDIYEAVMTRCLTRLIKHLDEPRFMDIGAFIGWYSIYVAKLLGERSQLIHSIEGNPKYCDMIRRSCELNGVNNVKLHEVILSNAAEPATMDGPAIVVGGSDTMTTTAISLDQLCARESIATPNIVKIDVHGSEGKVLFGMPSVLRTVDYLLLELHGHARLEELSGGIRRADILRMFWDLNLSVYYLAGHFAHPRESNRECHRSGRFAYRRVTPQNVGDLFFDRLWYQFLLVTRRDDVEEVLGESSTDPYWCY